MDGCAFFPCHLKRSSIEIYVNIGIGYQIKTFFIIPWERKNVISGSDVRLMNPVYQLRIPEDGYNVGFRTKLYNLSHGEFVLFDREPEGCQPFPQSEPF
jgi:hypothetical protein